LSDTKVLIQKEGEETPDYMYYLEDAEVHRTVVPSQNGDYAIFMVHGKISLKKREAPKIIDKGD